jgi:hypothetical protein
MLLSVQNLLSDLQDISAGAASSTTSTNVIDLGGDIPGLDRAWGGLSFLAQITAAVPGATALNLVLQTADNEAFSSPTTVATIPFSGVAAGDRAIIRQLPYGIKQRYLRAQYVATGTVTAGGKVTCGFTFGNDEFPDYI